MRRGKNMCRPGMLLALALLLLMPAARADMRMEALTGLADVQVFTDDNGIDTVIRPAGQPYFGETEREDTEILAYLDFVECPNEEDTVFIRLTFALETWEQLGANRISMEAGKQRYVFTVFPKTSEYDMTYYEDYVICFTDLSLPLLKAMGGSRTDDWTVLFSASDGEQAAVTMHLPHADVKTIYNAYVDARGPKQNLESFREIYPVTVEKASQK